MFLDGTSCLEVVGTYSNGHDAIEGIIATRPDVVLVDLDLSDVVSGVEVIRHVLEKGSNTECLVLTVYDDDISLFSVLRVGAVGYIVKNDATLPEIVQAIQNVIDGGSPMSVGIARRILSEFREASKTTGHLKVQGLSNREMEILELLATGRTTKKVAQDLHISYETVRCHQKNMYKKLHVHSLVEALAVLRAEVGSHSKRERHVH